MDVAKYAIAIAATLFCFWKAYEEGRAEGRFQGFLTALREVTTGGIAVEGDELVLSDDMPFVFCDPKTGERITRMRLDELEFKSE